jgi:pilus assembly protein CpaC
MSKPKGNRAMARLTRIAPLAALVAAAAMAPMTPVIAADARVPVIQVVASEATSRFVPLGIGKSVAIDLPSDIKDVLVADPKIANAVIRSSRRVYMIGVAIGQTNIFFFDADGKQIAGFDIAVTRDLNGLRGALKQTMPGADIRVEGVGDGIMLSGSAANAGEAQQAYELASRLVGDGTKVVNGITVRGRDQVMLKVTVAEVQRSVIKQLGVDLSGSLSYGSNAFQFNTSNPFSATGQALSNTSLIGPSGTPGIAGALSPIGGALVGDVTGTPLKGINATLRAMERAGVVRTLAEPNLTAISGETANFLVGGQFPYPTPPQSAGQAPGFEFKNFGVSLKFTPVVLSEGRISLKVMTEVSELSAEGGVTVLGITVPSLKVRRAETTLEIPSGGSLAMAGMIQEQTKQSINGLPGLMQLPILGTLFKSRDYINNQTELMVLVTPYIVRAVAQKQLSRPDDGFADPSDPSSALLGRLNRIYGSARPEPAASQKTYHGSYGFILD